MARRFSRLRRSLNSGRLFTLSHRRNRRNYFRRMARRRKR